jgi:hypothetical protein
MKNFAIFTLAILIVLCLWSCSQHGDDDEAFIVGNKLDDDAADDDAVDDDANNLTDDDAAPDDDDITVPNTDDDTYQLGEHPPILSYGIWDPNPAEYDASYDQTWSVLYFNICDLGDDLSGGILYVICEDCAPFWASVESSELDFIAENCGADLSPADDCDNPIELAFGIDFTGAPADDYCLDLEATDAAGELSNKLVNICVTVE